MPAPAKVLDEDMDYSTHPPNSTAIVHRCRFVEYQPSGINAMAFTPESCLQVKTMHPHMDKSRRFEKQDYEGVCYLACVRENGNIELWNAREGWFLEKIIPGLPDSAIECVTWVHEREGWDNYDVNEAIKEPRLFTAGLDGLLREWDITTLSPKYAMESNGGSVWCMAPNPIGNILAVGCEDGCVRLFKVNPLYEGSGMYGTPGLEYMKTLDKAEARILCVDWSPCGQFVIVGTSQGSIRKMDISTGRVTQRISVDTTKKKRKQAKKTTEADKTDEDTLVWAVFVLADGTIVSGDSLGNVCFWDAHTATLKQLAQVHAADVLCLTANKEGNIVYSSGVDRVIVQHRFINKSPEMPGKWIPSVQRRYHSHDVRGLALYTHETQCIDALVSGGVDTNLILSEPASKFDHVKQRRMPCWPHRPVVYTVKSMRWVVQEKTNGIKIWQLGEKASDDSCLVLSANPSALSPSEDYKVPLLKKEKLLVDMNIQLQSNLTSSAVSPLGTLIAISDTKQVKLFLLSTSSQGSLKLKKLTTLDTMGAVSMHFTPCETKLILCGFDSLIRVLDIVENSDGFHCSLSHTFDHHRGMVDEEMECDDEQDSTLVQPLLRGTLSVHSHHPKMKETCTILSSQLSQDGKWLVTGDAGNRIFIFDLESYKIHAALPLFSSLYTSLAFNPLSTILAVTLSSNELYLFDLVSKRFNDWTRDNIGLTPKWMLNRKEIISGASFASEHKLLLWSTSGCCVVDLTKAASVPSFVLNQAKRKRKQAKASPSSEPVPDIEHYRNFTRLDRFQPLMLLDFISESEMLVVERPLLKIMEALPEGFFRERYGT